jgi:phosphoglycolate phosphatase
LIARPSALVFDLDGTLVDSRRDIADALLRTLAAHDKPELPFEDILLLIGDGARALVARAFARVGSLAGEAALDRAVATFKALYAERPCVHTTLLPGAREVLDLGLPAALVTNKPREITRLVLEGLEISDALPTVWGGDDGPLKPAPDGILSVLGRLDVPPSRAWMIGDGPQDILAGKAAGCFTVAVPGIADLALVRAAEPDMVVASLHDLVAKLTSE